MKKLILSILMIMTTHTAFAYETLTNGGFNFTEACISKIEVMVKAELLKAGDTEGMFQDSLQSAVVKTSSIFPDTTETKDRTGRKAVAFSALAYGSEYNFVVHGTVDSKTCTRILLQAPEQQ